MGRSKKEVGTFTIISKTPKGQKRNTIYEIEYQRSGIPERKVIKVIWLDFREDDKRWAFMDGKEAEALTREEKDELIAEIPKFQKGSSYRKTHPVTLNEKEILRKQVKEKEYEIYELQQKIHDIEDTETEKLLSVYKSKVDTDRLEVFETKLKELVKDTGLMIKEKSWAYNNDLMIYDTTTGLPVGYVRYSKYLAKEGWYIESMSDYDFRQIISSDTTVRDRLKEDVKGSI